MHEQVKANARALGARLMSYGYKLVTDGTDNHLVLWDLRKEVRTDAAQATAPGSFRAVLPKLTHVQPLMQSAHATIMVAIYLSRFMSVWHCRSGHHTLCLQILWTVRESLNRLHFTPTAGHHGQQDGEGVRPVPHHAEQERRRRRRVRDDSRRRADWRTSHDVTRASTPSASCCEIRYDTGHASALRVQDDLSIRVCVWRQSDHGTDMKKSGTDLAVTFPDI